MSNFVYECSIKFNKVLPGSLVENIPVVIDVFLVVKFSLTVSAKKENHSNQKC